MTEVKQTRLLVFITSGAGSRSRLLLSTYGAAAVLRPIPRPPGDFPLGASEAALGLLDQEELLVQSVLLKLQPL